MSIPAYPLQWPEGWQRVASYQRKSAQFSRGGKKLSVSTAVERVRLELDRLGIHDDDLVISTNLKLRLDGFPRSDQTEPADPGVAVYWRNRRKPEQPPKCMAIDRYTRVADNLAAVSATLDAMRAIERHGGAAILERAFTGFEALPKPQAPEWRSVLDPLDPEGSYRRLRSQHHPDRGGDAAQFQRVQEAYEAYRQETGRG